MNDEIRDPNSLSDSQDASTPIPAENEADSPASPAEMPATPEIESSQELQDSKPQTSEKQTPPISSPEHEAITENPVTQEPVQSTEDQPATDPIATPAAAGDAVRTQEAKKKTLHTRLKLGAAMMASILGLMLADHFLETSYFFLILLLAATVTGLLEFYRMARQAGSQPWWFTGTVCGAGIVLLQWCFTEGLVSANPILQAEGGVLALIAYLVIIMVVNLAMPEKKVEAQNIAVTTFGVLYISFFMSFFIKIRGMPGGEAMIVLIFLSAKCTDIGAYLIGRRFGTIRLIPKVSPGKTVEGAFGGMVCGIVVTMLLYWLTGLHALRTFPVTTALVLGVIIVLASMGGDLFESLIKRRYQVKDSADLVPAFGGMLDMIDSLLLNGPLLYYFILATGILETPA